MKMIFSLLAAMTMTSAFAAPVTTNLQISPMIVGGVEVNPETTDTSFVVSIGGGCAGSIIAPRWILTAAHCKSIFSRSITGGSNSLRDSNRISMKMKKSYVHPKYRSSGTHDIALIELTEDLDLSSGRLSAIPFADSNLETSGGLEEGVMTTVYGWGVTRENGSQASYMREVDVPLVSREVANARESYKGQIDESMLAAGYAEGGRDACQGDSGGPLVTKDSEGRPTLVGIVSFGEGCARAKKYGIYSNVSYLNDWIVKTMNK